MRFALAMLTGALVLILAIAPRVRAQGHMHSMQHGDKKPAAAAAVDTAASADAVYTCPMDPEVVSKAPGKCPKCGMALVKKASAARPSAGPGGASSGKSDARPAKAGKKKGEVVSQASGGGGCCGDEAGGCAKE